MKEGICAQLFQRLGLTGKSIDKQCPTPANQVVNNQPENIVYDSVKRLNDFRLRQLSTGWTQGQAAAPNTSTSEDG